jgi:hypothetical protein
MQRLPFDFGELLDRLRREFRGGDADEDSAPVAFSLTMWLSMVGSVGS